MVFNILGRAVRRRAVPIMALAAAFCITTAAEAADFSDKRITIIIPYKEGGGTDTFARFFTPLLQEALPGKPLVMILNQPGGGGIKGTNYFQRTAKPDGLTILGNSASLMLKYAVHDKRLKADLGSYLPILSSATSRVVYAHPKVAAKKYDVRALKGKKLIHGGQTPLSGDLVVLLSYDMLGLDVKAVFGGSRGNNRLALLRGEFTVNYDTSSTYLKKIRPHVKSGKIVPLFAFGILDDNGNVIRDPSFPEIPTFVEAYEQIHGKKPSGPSFAAWKTLFSQSIKQFMLPAGTPQDIVETYTKAMKKIISEPDFMKRAEKVVGAYQPQLYEQAVKTLKDGAQFDPKTAQWFKKWIKEKHNIDIL